MDVAGTDRIGETNLNNQGLNMTIIDYKSYENITVEFEDGYVYYNARYQAFKNGEIRSLFFPDVCGVGFLGGREYPTHATKDKKTKCYETWKSMIKRVYNPNRRKCEEVYSDCIVCDEWHNFQNFAKWYYENYYEVDKCRMCLDKDILKKGNRIYSPETCMFVPYFVNLLFIEKNKTNGLPKSVRKTKNNKKYTSSIQIENKRIGLGVFNTVEDAFVEYKKIKESYVYFLAEVYKDQIPERLYNIMSSYTVEP